MPTHYDTIIIGAGQAGLAAGYYLGRTGSRFLILDAGEAIGESWRRRWDSLRLFTPARYNALPGMPFPGDPYALPGKDDVAAYLQEYAHRFELPVRFRSPVAELSGEDGHFVVRTRADAESLTASSVIVATGSNQRPHIPPFARELGPHVVQLHSSAYRRPDQLPDGPVLVAGAGNSGAQIALELAASNRRVYLSGPDPGSMPRTLLGRDLYDWLWPTLMRPRIDTWLGDRLLARRFAAADPVIGIGARDLTVPNLTRVPRTAGTRNALPLLADGRPLPDVATVIWCTGYRPDFSWIRFPIFDDRGYPRHHRGVVDTPRGLAFLGLRYQSRMGSALLGGVGEDAEWVVEEVSRGAAIARAA
jgi:putative flavoprotein involved in K+ transport